MNLRKAAEMALEVLSEADKRIVPGGVSRDVRDSMQNSIKELRQALAQPPVDWEAVAADQAMTIAMMKIEQEPVAFYVYKPTLPHGNLGMVSDGDLPWVYDQDPSSGYSARMLVYTAPSKREWVGLTYGEVNECAGTDILRFYRAIEAKLKEKNNE